MSDITEFLQSQRRDLTTAISEIEVAERTLPDIPIFPKIKECKRALTSAKARLTDSLAVTENAIRIDGGNAPSVFQVCITKPAPTLEGAWINDYIGQIFTVTRIDFAEDRYKVIGGRYYGNNILIDCCEIVGKQQIGEGATVESPDGTKWKAAVFCDPVTLRDMEMRVELAEKDT